MKKQKRNNANGITLIALVISIIVMLILAGVSLNAVVGENGVLTQAQNATIANRKAKMLEELNLELTSYNIDTITGNPEETKNMLGNLLDKDLVDTVLDANGEYLSTLDSPMGIPNFDSSNNYTGYIDYAVEKDGEYITISVDDSGIYTADFGKVTVGSGGSVAAGTTLVTSNAFNRGEGVTDPTEKGKFTIDNDASVMFVDEVSGELSILVKSGKHAKVSIFKNMTLTNAGIKRSAIDIEAGGELDLYVADGATVTVNSGLGEDASGNVPGKGGYAGIHVPEGATLTLKGTGTVKAIGGNAGNGGDGSVLTVTSGYANVGIAGGGGAGAGIGGNGGNGAVGKTQGKGSSGLNGENCGNINLANTVVVYAYGGAGGRGGSGKAGCYIAGGGGGYPGAGIGGGGAGGAGGTDCAGAGGYTGGTGRQNSEYSVNGLAGKYDTNTTNYIQLSGGGYFQGGLGSSLENILRESECLGGFNSYGLDGSGNHSSGTGGQGGKGGIVKTSNDVKVYAFNGNLYTDGLSGHDYQDGLNQCPIYAQCGIIIPKYSYDSSTKKIYNLTLNSAQTTVAKSGYENTMYTDNNTFKSNKTININTKLGITTNTLLTAVDMSKQGVGSGAGYTEVSNGTYTVDSSLN